MKTGQSFHFTKGVILYPLGLVTIIWLVFWTELHFELNLTPYGIFPRRLSGLLGILCSPFIHGSLSHLYQNTIPLLVLSMALTYFYKSVALRVFFLGIIFSGLLTWCIGSPAYHIGASGYIYVLMSFLLFKGFFSNHFRLIALSLLVVFLYGGMIWFIFPLKENMSWEGHFSGFITGLCFAFWFQKDIPKPASYNWQRPDFDESSDPFLKHFDDNGNFIEISDKASHSDNRHKVQYHYNQEE